MAAIQLKALINSGVIVDVLDHFTPFMNLKVIYNLQANIEVSNGCVFKPSIVANYPFVEIEGGDFDSFFTLVMTDPDAPSPSNPNKREHLHWLMSDIQGTPRIIANYGRELVTYESPNPINGIHRYVFALFKQTRENCVTPPSSRDNFNTMKFAEENDLGLPVAAIYFKSERDPAPVEAVVGSNF